MRWKYIHLSLGDENILSVEKSDDLDDVKPGDKLMIDYGTISFTVKGIETFSETTRILSEKDPQKYANGLPDERKSIVSPTSDPRNLSPLLKRSQTDDIEEVKQKNKFFSEFQKEKEKRKQKKTIITTVDMNCHLTSRKSLFIRKAQMTHESLEHLEFMDRWGNKSPSSLPFSSKSSIKKVDSTNESGLLTPWDIKTINASLGLVPTRLSLSKDYLLMTLDGGRCRSK